MTPYGGKYIALSFHAFHIWRDYFFVYEWYKGKVGLEISLVFIRGVLDIVIILMTRMTFAILSSEKLANSEMSGRRKLPWYLYDNNRADRCMR